MLNTEKMRSLPRFFLGIPDPRRGQGRRHLLPTVLGIAVGAVLCGIRGYHAIAEWADNLDQRSRQRFRYRRENGQHVVPSKS